MTKSIPESAAPATNGLRTYTASAKLTPNEFSQLEQRAARAKKRVGEWCREVLLQELNGHELPDVLLAEVLGLRMIVLNMLAPYIRGERPTTEEFEKMLAHVDARKMKRAIEMMREAGASQKGRR